MDRDQAAEDRLDAGRLEAGFADHRLKRFHLRKSADRFDQVAIAFLILGDRLADFWNEMLRIAVVEIAEAGPFAGREFEYVKAATALEDAMRLAQGCGNVGYVPDAEGDRIGVRAGVGEA